MSWDMSLQRAELRDYWCVASRQILGTVFAREFTYDLAACCCISVVCVTIVLFIAERISMLEGSRELLMLSSSLTGIHSGF